MKYSEIKELYSDLEDLGIENPRYILENLDVDFYSECDNYRIIKDDDIDSIQCEELGSDLYMLGCFNASFLAMFLSIDADLIQIIQEAGKYEELGKAIIDADCLEELQEDYVSADGYGHHFAHYDHNDNEININGDLYHVFKVN